MISLCSVRQQMKLLCNTCAGKHYLKPHYYVACFYSSVSYTDGESLNKVKIYFAADKHKNFEGQLSFCLRSVLSQTSVCPALGSPCPTKRASVHCLPDLLKPMFSTAFLFFLSSFSIASNTTPGKSRA